MKVVALINTDNYKKGKVYEALKMSVEHRLIIIDDWGEEFIVLSHNFITLEEHRSIIISNILEL